MILELGCLYHIHYDSMVVFGLDKTPAEEIGVVKKSIWVKPWVSMHNCQSKRRVRGLKIIASTMSERVLGCWIYPNEIRGIHLEKIDRKDLPLYISWNKHSMFDNILKSY